MNKKEKSFIISPETLFDIAGVMFIILDLDGNVSRINPKGCEILEYDQDEIIGKNWFENFLPSSVQKNVKKVFSEIIKGLVKPVEYNENVIITKHGEEKTIIWHNSYLKDKLGNITGTLSSGLDITDRIKAEQAFRESEEKYRLAMDATADGLWDWNIKNGSVYYSPAWLKMIHAESEKPFYDLWATRLHPDDKEKVLASLHKCLKGNLPYWQQEHRIKSGDKTWKWVLERGKIVAKDNKGKPVRMIGTMTDITKRKRIETELSNEKQKLDLIANSLPALISYIDKNMKYKYVNNKYEEWFNIPKKNIINKHMQKVVGESVFQNILPYFKTALNGQITTYELDWEPPNLGKKCTQATLTPHRNDKGKIVGVYALVIDITERKIAEQALIESEKQYRILVDSAIQPIFTINKDGQFLFMNVAAAKFLGGTPTNFAEKTMWDIFPKHIADIQMEMILKAINSGTTISSIDETVISGEKMWFSAQIQPIQNEQNIYDRCLVILTDITEKRNAELALQTILKGTEHATGDMFFRNLILGLSNVLDVRHVFVGQVTGTKQDTVKTIALCENNTILENMEYNLKNTPCENVIGKTICIYENDICTLFPKDKLLSDMGIISYMGIPLFNNTRQPLGIMVALDDKPMLKSEFSKSIFTAFADRASAELERMLTEEALRENEKNFRMLFETMTQGVIYQDSKGKILNVNPAAENILKIPLADMKKNKSPFSMFKTIHQDGSRYLIKEQPAIIALETGLEVKNQVMGLFNETTNKWIWININAIPQYQPNSKKPDNVYTIFEDITQKKQAEIQLQKNLKEKEFMLKEIHHRVKNNLNIITSLLNLQSMAMDKKCEVNEAFKESVNRIHSMALIHERLYESRDFSSIEFFEYIKSLTKELVYIYDANRSISIKYDVDKIFLDINTAIPFGLILNELVTNALKHAFPDKKEGKVEIIFKELGHNKYDLKVIDNGIGLKKDLKISKFKSLGLRLINLLVEQIDGTLKISEKNGTIFNITFPKE